MTMHPRLMVVPVGAEDRAETVATVRPHARLVDHDDLAASLQGALDRRMEHDEAVRTELEERRAELESRFAAAERVLTDLTDEQQRTRRAAEWCEQQPALDAEDTARLSSAAEELEDHASAVREANRKLERVLEQRAAAEAAIEDAREHLEGLEAAGFDETGVRRQIEEASRDLRDASAGYQERMKDLARCQAAVDRLEAAQDAVRPIEAPDHRDRLQSMRAVIDAKFAAAAPGSDRSTPSEEDVASARDALRESEAVAEAAAERLGAARQRVSALEAELTVRSDGETSQEARYEAALELEAQVTSVESRLGEAEVDARAEVDEATRAMTRADLDLDRLRERLRDRRRHLAGYARLVPEDQRSEVESDPLLHARLIARALRAHADAMQPDRDRALARFENERAAHEATLAELEQRRAGRGVVTSEDRRELVRSLGGDGGDVVVLDDIVGRDRDLSTSDLDAGEPSSPLIVLTHDPEVVGWAIELPADRGAVVSAAALRGWFADPPAVLALTDTASRHRSKC